MEINRRDRKEMIANSDEREANFKKTVGEKRSSPGACPERSRRAPRLLRPFKNMES